MIASFSLGLSLAYAGFTAVCLAMDRHHRQVFGRPSARRTATTLRVLGYALLALAAVPAVRGLGGSTGFVLWLGTLSVAALLLTFQLPYAPRFAAGCAVLAPLLALAIQ